MDDSTTLSPLVLNDQWVIFELIDDFHLHTAWRYEWNGRTDSEIVSFDLVFMNMNDIVGILDRADGMQRMQISPHFSYCRYTHLNQSDNSWISYNKKSRHHDWFIFILNQSSLSPIW